MSRLTCPTLFVATLVSNNFSGAASLTLQELAIIILNLTLVEAESAAVWIGTPQAFVRIPVVGPTLTSTPLAVPVLIRVEAVRPFVIWKAIPYFSGMLVTNVHSRRLVARPPNAAPKPKADPEPFRTPGRPAINLARQAFRLEIAIANGNLVMLGVASAKRHAFPPIPNGILIPKEKPPPLFGRMDIRLIA